jgi:hypothetical protein
MVMAGTVKAEAAVVEREKEAVVVAEAEAEAAVVGTGTAEQAAEGTEAAETEVAEAMARVPEETAVAAGSRPQSRTAL